jgi:muconolactone delta-isomerase
MIWPPMAQEQAMAGKFLVLWRLQMARVSPEMMRAVLRQQDYGARLLESGKLDARYHLVGGHGGAWIYNVESNEELDRLLAQSPVYNMASYAVHPLAEMTAPTLLGESQTR